MLVLRSPLFELAGGKQLEDVSLLKLCRKQLNDGLPFNYFIVHPQEHAGRRCRDILFGDLFDCDVHTVFLWFDAEYFELREGQEQHFFLSQHYWVQLYLFSGVALDFKYGMAAAALEVIRHVFVDWSRSEGLESDDISFSLVFEKHVHSTIDFTDRAVADFV